MQESALLYTGHLIVVLMEQDPKGLLEPMKHVMSLSAGKAINSEMPSCVKSFILPIAYAFMTVGESSIKMAILTDLFAQKSDPVG